LLAKASAEADSLRALCIARVSVCPRNHGWLRANYCIRDNSAHTSGVFPERWRVFYLGNGVVEARRVDRLTRKARVGRLS